MRDKGELVAMRSEMSTLQQAVASLAREDEAGSGR
jgi:hypothetical protein